MVVIVGQSAVHFLTLTNFGAMKKLDRGLFNMCSRLHSWSKLWNDSRNENFLKTKNFRKSAVSSL